MDHLVELLTVSDHFAMERGLVVTPDFAPPVGWKARSEPAVVVTPDGESREMTACLEVWHFEIRDPARADKRWRLVLLFPAAGNEDVPLGSKVMVSQQLKAAVDLGAPKNSN
jgi:hypothetical protein